MQKKSETSEPPHPVLLPSGEKERSLSHRVPSGSANTRYPCFSEACQFGSFGGSFGLKPNMRSKRLA